MKYEIQITGYEPTSFFKKGVWYKNLKYKGSFFRFKSISGEALKGPGVNTEGVWYGYEVGAWGIYDGYRVATHNEILQALKKEAIKRGFKGDISGINMKNNIVGRVFPSGTFTSGKNEKNAYDYRMRVEELRFWGVAIYRDGEWVMKVV